MKAQALKKYIRSSPRKMRFVIDNIRGKRVDEALTLLKFMPHFAATEAEKTVKSALGNINDLSKDDGISYDAGELIISKVLVNQGPTTKRMLPAPMGRAYRIRKRSNHLTIVIQTLDHVDEVIESTDNDEVLEAEQS